MQSIHHSLRKGLRFLLGGFVVLSLWNQAWAADGTPLDVLSAAKWKVVSGETSHVQLNESNGVLALDYDVEVGQRRKNGHRTEIEGSFSVELKEPVVLTPEQMRIYFETRNPGKPADAKLVSVLPVIEDEHGERLFYRTETENTYFGKAPSPTGWQLAKTGIFWMTEAGGAAQDIYSAEGGDQNKWPDGKLKFVGFQVRVYTDPGKLKPGRRAGKLFLGEISTGGARPSQPEFVYADGLLEKKGNYRVGFEVRSVFQASPVKETVQNVAYDSESEASRKQRIAFPVADLHTSWVRYGIADESGAAVATGEIRWDRDQSPANDKLLPAVDLAQAPKIGLVRFIPASGKANASDVGGVYRPNDPFVIGLRIFKPEGAQPGLKLKWKLTPYVFKGVIDEKEQTLDFKGKPFVNVPVKPKIEEGRDAYKFVYAVEDASGRTLDSGEYVAGIARPKIEPYGNRQGRIPHRDEIKRHPYFRTSFTGAEEMRKTADEKQVFEAFKSYMDESEQMANHSTYMMEASEFEVLPGVYNFAVLDKVMDLAADYRFGVTVRFAHTENNPYTWQPFTTPRNFDGTPLYGHRYYGAFALTDPRYVQLWTRAFRALHERYGKHPAFEGYFVMKPGGEWTIPDQPWAGVISDYSWGSIEAFRTYLQKNLGLDLAGLNARWGSSYKAWSEVPAPQPSLMTGSKPDLRPEWADFCNWKRAMAESWYPMVTKDIRSYDPTHVIIAYGGFSEPLDQLGGVIDYLHNGGNHFLEGDGALVNIWKNGRVGWITEPHHPTNWAAYGDPANRGWVLDWSIYVATAQAGGGGANLHVYIDPRTRGYSIPAHSGGMTAFDRFEMFKPVLEELQGISPIEPKKEVAVIQDESTLLTKHRTTFGGRTVDLRRWFDLLRSDAVDFEPYRADREANYKLVLLNPLDEVLGAETISKLDRMVRDNGATLLMSARSGWFAIGKPSESFPLLKQLGIDPPTGSFEINKGGIVATVEPNEPLAAVMKSMPFFTQEDFRTDYNDPKNDGQEFFRWPYRWIPEADYFGYYRDNRGIKGEVIARFPDGGVAVSRHNVGKGKVMVLWGTPAMKPEQMKGFLAAAAAGAGVTDAKKGNVIPYMLEASSDALQRHYALLFQETPGDYVQKIPNVPDGVWFVDDMVSGQRLGFYSGKEMREKGVSLVYPEGFSPLKILRMLPKEKVKALQWAGKYRQAQ